MLADTKQVRKIARFAAAHIGATIWGSYTDEIASLRGTGDKRRYVGFAVSRGYETKMANLVEGLLQDKGFTNPVRTTDGYVRLNAVIA